MFVFVLKVMALTLMKVLSSVLFLQAPEWLLDYWHPSEKAMYPDYFSKREQWKKLRMESWEKEVGNDYQSVCIT